MARQTVYTVLGLIALSLGLVQCAHTPHATSLQVSPGSASLTSVGQTVQFEAFAGVLTGNESSTEDVTNQATWSSGSTSVATINASGLATAVSAGTTTITATLQSPTAGVLVATATLTIAAGAVPRDLASITIIPSSQNVSNVGETIQFAAVGNYSAPPTTVEITGQVTWASSDTTVATITAAGVATGVGAGTTTITATATAPVSGATIIGTATLTVSASAVPRDLVSITIIPSSQSVTSVGETTQFKAIGNYSASPTTQDLTTQATWQSSDVTVAKINSTGLASAVSAGTTSVEASFTANSGAVITGIATLTVSATAVPRDLTSITIIPSSQTVNALGEYAQFIAIGNYSGAPTTADLTDEVTWQSSDVDVATINSTGLAIGNDKGTTTIAASATANSGATIVGTALFTQSGTGGTGTLLPTLTVFELGAGAGSVVSNATATTQAGLVTCPSTSAANSCTASFPLGTAVTLTATASSGSTFGGWSANCTPNPVEPNVCTVVMNGNQPVAAIFNLNQP